jgi:hypothetical protein
MEARITFFDDNIIGYDALGRGIIDIDSEMDALICSGHTLIESINILTEVAQIYNETYVLLSSKNTQWKK